MVNRLTLPIRIFAICVIWIISGLTISAQKIYTTKSGQTIQLNPNGQWQYLEEGTLDEQGLIAETELEVDPYELPTSTYNISDEELKVYESLKEQLQYFEADYFVRHLIIKNKIDNSQSDDTDKKLEKELKDKYKTSYQLLDRLAKFNKSDRKERGKIIESVTKKLVDEFKFDMNIDASDKDKSATKSRTVNLPSFIVDDRSPFEIIRDNRCEVIYDGEDKQLGKKRKEIKSARWFTYTHPKLLNHFKSNDFLTGEAALMKIGKKTYINLRLILATRDARRSYGYIQEEAMLRISLINGDKIYLRNQVRSNGNLEAYTGNTVYQCIYSIEGEYVKELKRTEIDRVGIMWSTGFEEYEVYEVDFLMNQLYCLDND